MISWSMVVFALLTYGHEMSRVVLLSVLVESCSGIAVVKVAQSLTQKCVVHVDVTHVCCMSPAGHTRMNVCFQQMASTAPSFFFLIFNFVLCSKHKIVHVSHVCIKYIHRDHHTSVNVHVIDVLTFESIFNYKRSITSPFAGSWRKGAWFCSRLVGCCFGRLFAGQFGRCFGILLGFLFRFFFRFLGRELSQPGLFGLELGL
jgi:hypothetical protein